MLLRCCGAVGDPTAWTSVFYIFIGTSGSPWGRSPGVTLRFKKFLKATLTGYSFCAYSYRQNNLFKLMTKSALELSTASRKNTPAITTCIYPVCCGIHVKIWQTITQYPFLNSWPDAFTVLLLAVVIYSTVSIVTGIVPYLSLPFQVGN